MSTPKNPVSMAKSNVPIPDAGGTVTIMSLDDGTTVKAQFNPKELQARVETLLSGDEPAPPG